MSEIKVALVGCGGRGNGAVADCLGVPDQVKLVAVADAFEDRAKVSAESLRRKFADKVDLPAARVFSGFDAYQQAIHCGVDLVLLATPPGFRPIHYAAAVQAGKHVFMETPCCVDAPGFRSLLQTNKVADEKGLKVGVGLQRRHDPGYVEGIKEIHDGAIGDLLFLRAYGNGGGVWVRPREPGQTEMQYQMRNWYYFVWLCGDHICEQHVHNLDVANWLRGDHPVEANGLGGRQVRKGKDHGQIFDHHSIEFTYKDGTKLFSQCRHIRGCFNSIAESAHGTKGVSNCRSGGKRAKGAKTAKRTAYQQEHVDLIAAMRKDQKYNEGWYGATSSMTAVLGRMASYSGQVVKWDDAAAHGPSEMPAKFAWDAQPPVMPDAHGNYPVPVPGIYQPFPRRPG
jgi:predicted dehydrogenase